MEAKSSYYPEHFFRVNTQGGTFAEIAIEHYYTAFDALNKIKKNHYYDSKNTELKYLLQKSVYISIVFAASAIEAFLNDYAAACIGDSDFYDNFDKLSVLSKFQLIVQFIMHSNIDKSQAYYGCLKQLEKIRNEIVHSKSQNGFSLGIGYTKSEIDAIHEDMKLCEYKLCEIDYSDDEELVRSCKMGLNALKEISIYFDKHDGNIHACRRFIPGGDAFPTYGNNHPYMRFRREFEISNAEKDEEM